MGASRLLSFSAGMVLQLVPVLCRSPRRFLAVCPPLPRGSRGALKPARSMGVRRVRAEISLPVEAGAETPVVVQGARARSRVARGCDHPLARWVQGEPKSPCVAMQRRPGCAQPGRARCPSALKRPVDQSLGETLRKGAGEPRDCPGGCAGDGKSPRKVSAVLPRTPCTFF